MDELDEKFITTTKRMHKEPLQALLGELAEVAREHFADNAILQRASSMASGYEERLTNQHATIHRLVTHHQAMHADCDWTTPAASEGTSETSKPTEET
jgi:hypothetical protein